MSTIMEPVGSVTGSPAPMAAAIGSFDEEYLARARAFGGVLNGAALDRC